jgi:hypothetical protein
MPAIQTSAMPKGRGHGPLLRPCLHSKTGKKRKSPQEKMQISRGQMSELIVKCTNKQLRRLNYIMSVLSLAALINKKCRKANRK